mmetsp:Transcript_33872/g.80867  ORF Transcript_33872/g.80867 Transcript_33872/m.80867 type:complete len:871 (-) Transcript_33872:235-2847(-)
MVIQQHVALQCEALAHYKPDKKEGTSLHAVRKLNTGIFDLSLDDIEELFQYLDDDHNGALEFAEIARLFKAVLSPPCTDTEVEILFELTDKNSNGLVNIGELQRALREGPFRDHILQLQREATAKQALGRSMGHKTSVSREQLVERLNWRANRDDSFRTLPLSLVVLIVFSGLVVLHLQVWKRQQLQRGIEQWVDGYGANYPGPYHGEHVGDPTQMWEWLVSSGLTSLLGYCRNDSATGQPLCPFATRHVLVGDVRLRQRRRGGAVRSEWLLHSPPAREHLRASPGDLRGAAAATSRVLWSSGWADGDTDSLDLVLTSWNERVGMFAITEVRADFDSWGFVVPHTVARAVVIEPYSEKWILVVDVIYLMLLIYPTYGELKDIFSGMRVSGLRSGCKDYWGFWNGIDWMSIVLGWTNIALWLAFCMATQADAIQGLLEVRDTRDVLVSHVMSLETGVLEAAEENLSQIAGLFYALQIIMGFNVVSIMLKFFKAFQANPRLQLVTNTLIQASDELFHFLIVFLAIFMGFSVSGHILFGDDLIEFSSFDRSMDTSFRTLLGDFGWYSEQSVSDKGLGSGLPHFMLALWFCSYSTFVTLIILNMLLAIIMDHYSALVTNVRAASDAPTIWKQTTNYIKRARDTKGFIPIFTMLHQLRDKDNPAHLEDSVTEASLMEAFGGMKAEQAEFIMKWLTTWAAERARAEGDEENIARLKEVSSLLQAMSDQVHVISLSTSLVTNRLHDLQSSVAARLDSLETNVSTTVAKIADLETSMQRGQEPSSNWSRTAPLLQPLHLTPHLDERAHASARLTAHGREDQPRGSPGAAQSPANPGVAEPKLVAETPARAKREKLELQPCCGPAQRGAKSTIAADRRR